MSPSGSPAPWGGCWPRTARGGSPAPPTSSGPCNPSPSVPSLRSWPCPFGGRLLVAVLPTSYSVLHGCEFPRIRLRLSWSATVDLPSRRQWRVASNLPPFRRAHISDLRPVSSWVHPKASLVAILSTAARTQTDSLRQHAVAVRGGPGSGCGFRVGEQAEGHETARRHTVDAGEVVADHADIVVGDMCEMGAAGAIAHCPHAGARGP